MMERLEPFKSFSISLRQINNQTSVCFTFVDLSSHVASCPPISFSFNLSIPLFVSASNPVSLSPHLSHILLLSSLHLTIAITLFEATVVSLAKSVFVSHTNTGMFVILSLECSRSLKTELLLNASRVKIFRNSILSVDVYTKCLACKHRYTIYKPTIMESPLATVT